MINLIKNLIKRKEKVKVIFSKEGEIIIKSKKGQFIIKNKDLDEVPRKVLYFYNKLRENGEILKFQEAVWLINMSYTIIIETHRISVRGHGFEFEFRIKGGLLANIAKINEIEKAITDTLSYFQEVLSQVNK